MEFDALTTGEMKQLVEKHYKVPCVICEGKGYNEENFSFYMPCKVCHGSGMILMTSDYNDYDVP